MRFQTKCWLGDATLKEKAKSGREISTRHSWRKHRKIFVIKKQISRKIDAKEGEKNDTEGEGRRKEKNVASGAIEYK